MTAAGTPDWRDRLAAQIDPELRGRPGLSGFNRVIVGAILVLIAVGVLETEVEVVARLGPALMLIELAFFGLFLGEYALRLLVARCNPRYGSALRYARTPAALLDLAVLVSFVSPWLGLEATVFRLLRVARLLRLARLGRYSRAMQLLYDAARSRAVELGISAVLAFGLMLSAATLLWLVEAEAQPQAFGSIPRAMWWAVATLTTVGYGDLVPVTGLGRVLAAVTALCGIGIIALPTGLLAGAFADAIRRARNEADAGEASGAAPDAGGGPGRISSG
jgi:voltage-gated potassium channel